MKKQEIAQEAFDCYSVNGEGLRNGGLADAIQKVGDEKAHGGAASAASPPDSSDNLPDDPNNPEENPPPPSHRSKALDDDEKETGDQKHDEATNDKVSDVRGNHGNSFSVGLLGIIASIPKGGKAFRERSGAGAIRVMTCTHAAAVADAQPLIPGTPKRIRLNLDHDYRTPEHFDVLEEVSWCAHPQGPDDIEYALAQSSGNPAPLEAEEIAWLLGKYRKLCVEIGRGDSYHLSRIDAAIAASKGNGNG